MYRFPCISRTELHTVNLRMPTDIRDKRHQREGDINNPREERHRQLGWTKESHQCLCVLNDSRQQCGGGRCEWCQSMQQTMHQRQAELYLHTTHTHHVSSPLMFPPSCVQTRSRSCQITPAHRLLGSTQLHCDSVSQVHLCSEWVSE